MSENKKKILIISNSTYAKASNIGFRAYQINKFKPSNFEIYYLVRDYEISAENISKVYPFGDFIPRFLSFLKTYIYSNLKSREIDNRLFAFFLKYKLRKIKKKEFDIIHLWERELNIYKLVNKIKSKIVVDIAILGEINENNTLSYKDTSLRIVKYFSVPSEFTKSNLVKINKKSEIFVNHFGVDIDYNYKKDNHNKIINFLFVGRVENRKGVENLVEVWKKIGNKPNVNLIICGRVNRDLLYLKKDKSIKNIKFTGFVDPKPYYKNASVFVLPSRKEGSAKVIFEAMNYSLPVITTPNSGSIISNFYDGLIIRPESKDDLEKAMIFFINNPSKIDLMGKRARSKVMNYSWENYAKKTFDMYLSII